MKQIASRAGRSRRRPRLPTGIGGAVFWLALWYVLLWLLRKALGPGHMLLASMQILVGGALGALVIGLLWRLINRHLLWSLRNKLTLTYLLIGLAPFVLFLTFVTISAWVAAGQFSIHLADSRMREELDELAVDNASRADRMARVMQLRQAGAFGPAPGRGGTGRGTRPGPRGPRPTLPRAAAPAAPATPAADSSDANATADVDISSETLPDRLRARLHPHVAVYVNGVPAAQGPGAGPAAASPQIAAQGSTAPSAPLGLPPWAANLRDKEFRGLVIAGQNLYLVVVDQRQVPGSSSVVSTVTSLEVDTALVDLVARGLGRVILTRLTPPPAAAGQTPASETARLRQNAARHIRLRLNSVQGGTDPIAVRASDFRVSFTSTLDTIDWETGAGATVPVTIQVHSRPSLLYRQLFGSSLTGVFTSIYRIGLTVLCVLFALIEALALWMALGLSRNITGSVGELYAATQRVDHGDLVHRIPAIHSRKRDQLGELARSFNRMTSSLERLLVEQKEKERLQNELSIAQEVQANLFPHDVQNLPKLELHGICRPARSVSGDYYDFLVFRHPDQADGTPGTESGVGIAIGDISGKGISAALLMATLHSAVRAYRFAGEELVYCKSAIDGLTASREPQAGDGGKLFESPGRILALLNRHLYRSTQPAKYATLFLGHYNADTARMTYSNAGHLPPLVLSRDGNVRRLDCGGTVVGLIDGMHYEEGQFQMMPGDIFVAYSDGVTEPENDFGEFGEARLMEIVARYRDEPLGVISAQVMLALDAWIGAAEQPDDITLVLARQM